MRRLVSWAHDAVVGAASRLPRRRIGGPGDGLRVNLGSGLVVADGWVHVDVGLPALVSKWPGSLHRLLYRMMPSTSATKDNLTPEDFSAVLRSHRFVHHDLRRPLPFADGSARFVYTSHVVEHLYREEAERLFQETARILEPGGVFRVVVPDLAHAVELYRRGQAEEALRFFFYGDGPSAYTRHRYMWDERLLRCALERAGFARVARVCYREGRTPDLDRLDNRPDESLYMEAVAP